MKFRNLILLFVLMAGGLFAQQTGGGGPLQVTSDPAGACAIGSNMQYNNTNGKLWGCDSGTWTQVSGGGGGSMTWPSTPGISVCTGTPCTAWGTSLTAPAGTIVGTSDTQVLTNKTVDGVSPSTFAFLDPTSSVQTQLNAKAAVNASTNVNGQTCALGSNCTISAGTTIYTGTANPNGVGTIFSPTNMTSNTLPTPYVVSNSTAAYTGSTCGGSSYWQIFSLAANCQVVTGAAPPQSVTIDLGSSLFVLTQYKMLNATSGNAYAPVAWTMAGSNDGSSFTTLDTQTSQTFTGGAYNTYTIGSPGTTTYRYFRLNISLSTGSPSASWGLTSLQLFSAGVQFNSGVAGDFFLQTNTKQIYGPRPAGGVPSWPLFGTVN